MLRRTLAFAGLAAAVILAVRAPLQADNRAPEKTAPLRAIVHVNFSDPERQGHGLKNIENILKEVGDAAEIEVVAHGAGIGLLVQGQSPHAGKIQSLIARNVKFAACKNTLRDKSIPQERLLPGVQVVPSGAVEVLRKQQEGFGYFRP